MCIFFLPIFSVEAKRSGKERWRRGRTLLTLLETIYVRKRRDFGGFCDLLILHGDPRMRWWIDDGVAAVFPPYAFFPSASLSLVLSLGSKIYVEKGKNLFFLTKKIKGRNKWNTTSEFFFIYNSTIKIKKLF